LRIVTHKCLLLKELSTFLARGPVDRPLHPWPLIGSSSGKRTKNWAPTEQYTPGVRIEWNGQVAEVREAGLGPAVVLIHGYPLDGAMWSGVARAMATGLRILKPDLPGHGENAAPATESIEGQADFLEAILAELPGPVGLAAFSMGGYAALALMKRRPEKVRALALVDTRAGADDEAGRVKRDEAIAVVRAGGVAPIAQAMIGKLLSPEGLKRADLVERANRIMTRQKPETVAADLAAMRGRADQTASLSSIAVPTLVVVGELDTLTPPSESQAITAAIPGARLIVVPGAGHLAPMERPRAVAAALSEFFTPVLSA
jgi:3-oxoadipate enol-lactonase